MIFHWLIQFAIVAGSLALGGWLLPGVRMKPLSIALGAALFLGIISLILEDLHHYLVLNLAPYYWTFFYILWDALWLGVLSRFISGFGFRKWWWALLLAAFIALLQTLGWWLLPMPG